MRRRVQLAAGVLALAVAAAADPAPTPPVDAQALAQDGRYAEAYAALIARGADRDPTALRALARAMLMHGIDSPETFERWAAMRAARNLREPELAGPALRQLEGDGRYEQALALEILSSSAPRASRAAFITALDSPHRTIRLRALRALHDAEDRETLQERIATLTTDDPDPDVRIVAVRTLRDWGASGSLTSLRRAATEGTPAVRQEAVAALIVLGDPKLVDLVRQSLADAPPTERARAIRLAGMVPSPSLLPMVIPFLSDADPEVRTAAAAAVLSITAPPPVP